MRRLEIMKILEILRLQEMGLSKREIAASVQCGKTTVSDVERRCLEHALTFESARNMTNNELSDLLYPKAKPPGLDNVDWEEVYRQLTYKDENRRKTRKNLRYIWEEWMTEHPGGMSYSQFCRRYTAWKADAGRKADMPIEREPGRECMVDWCGDTLDCVVDIETGELLTAHFFVATLGDSYYPYVEAFSDEKSDKWLTAHVNALHYYGGLPRVIIPDNTKTAVKKPSYYDPAINTAYLDFAQYYGVAIIPTRVCHPKDKSPVEGSIGWLETWLLEWLRGQVFYSFRELNVSILQRVAQLARRKFQKRPGSRESIFQSVDKPALRPLPARKYKAAEFVQRRVPTNYHVEYQGFYYSVNYTLLGQMVMLRITANMVEILNEDRQRTAAHVRRYTGSRYVTDLAHMPENHRQQYKLNHWTGDRYRDWAATIGENTALVIDRLLKAPAAEEQAYRSCMGILQMSEKHGIERLEAACRKAIAIRSVTYTTVRNILKNGQESMVAGKPTGTTPSHENLRGNIYL